jgi:transposase
MIESRMATVSLRNDQWKKILAFLRENPKVYVGKERQCRRFVEGVLWMMKSGAQWRLLPKTYGNWNSVFKRFDRWSEGGIWQEMFERFADDPDMERLLLDSSVVRAHACAAGAPEKRGGRNSRHSAIAVEASAARFM